MRSHPGLSRPLFLYAHHRTPSDSYIQSPATQSQAAATRREPPFTEEKRSLEEMLTDLSRDLNSPGPFPGVSLGWGGLN